MEAARSRSDSHEARGSRYDTLRVPYYAEDLMSNNPTQPQFVSLPNSDLMRLHNGRTSNMVDFPTYSNEEAAMMNSMHPLVYADHRDFNSLRRFNLQNECTNWSTTNPTELSSIDHSNTQNAMFIRSVNPAPARYLVNSNGYRPDHHQNPSKYDSIEVSRNEQEHGTRGLSLSLSSNPSNNADYMKQHNLGFHKCSKHGGKESGKALEDVTGISTHATQWSSGPLGPFTGYASILKSSKFLKPAQEMLDGICDFHGEEPIEIRVLLKSIAEESGGDDGGWSSSSNSFATESQQKKATLFYMYDEVCRRYKHYYQQMQMVVSSFESVAGLGAATPYVYLALKAVTRNFKCLKSAISEQLRNVKRSLVEDNAPSQQIGTSQVNRGFQKRRSCLGVNTSFFDAQSHGWRPQRGLPERSVAVLRAWLFEHFLHPYPTDHDKHMLASQTGLSRNQVSNWFINARVRLWKPMVEEIHELETKCVEQHHQDNTNPSEKHHIHDNSSLRETNNQPSHNPNAPTESNTDELIGFSGIIGLSGDPRDRQWDPEIRSRLECHQVPVSMEGSFVGLDRFPQSGVAEFGAVSLSLGLRHNVGGTQQQQQQQHFGRGD